MGGGWVYIGSVKRELAALLWYQVYFENMQLLREGRWTLIYTNMFTLWTWCIMWRKIRNLTCYCVSGQMAEHTQAFYVVMLFELCELMVQSSTHNTVCRGCRYIPWSHLEGAICWSWGNWECSGISRRPDLWSSAASSCPTRWARCHWTDDWFWKLKYTHTNTCARRQPHTHTHANTHIIEWASSLQMHETITLHLFFNFISTKLEMH